MARKRILNATAALEADLKSQEPKVAKGPFKLEKYLFDKQLKFVTDPRPFKIAVCSRRSGKTISCAADLIYTAYNNPNTTSLYITLSRANAKKIIWKDLLKINDDYALGGTTDSTELSMTFPNGSIIYLSGAKDDSEIEKFRGLALKLVYLDECQSFKAYIEDLIDDILAPALIDYAGRLVLIGTPGPVPAGFFYDCDKDPIKSKHWSQHSWTFWDNPFITLKANTTHDLLLKRELDRRGVDSNDPSIQREFFGRWIEDQNSLWIKYNIERNHYDKLPEGKYNYIFGIDLGYEDCDAIAVIAWSEASKMTYLVDEVLVKKQGITELVEQIQDLQGVYKPDKMIIDEGGLGKKVAEEIRRRHHIPVQGADKQRKQENAAFLNDTLNTGLFKAKKDSVFAQDAFKVEIDWNKSTPDRIKVSDKYHSDMIDAVLYAFKESPAFTYQKLSAAPQYGSEEWAKKETDSMFDAELEKLQNEQEMLEIYPFLKD